MPAIRPSRCGGRNPTPMSLSASGASPACRLRRPDQPPGRRSQPTRAVESTNRPDRQHLADDLVTGLVSVLRLPPTNATAPSLAAASRAAFLAGGPEHSTATSTPRPPVTSPMDSTGLLVLLSTRTPVPNLEAGSGAPEAGRPPRLGAADGSHHPHRRRRTEALPLWTQHHDPRSPQRSGLTFGSPIGQCNGLPSPTRHACPRYRFSGELSCSADPDGLDARGTLKWSRRLHHHLRCESADRMP